MEEAHRRYRLPKSHRLRKPGEFRAVYDLNTRKRVGPFTVLGRANGLTHPRLGLSVGRRVGHAVRRHRVKRLLREAFRLEQHDLPAGVDLVVVAYAHDAIELDEVRRLLRRGAESVARRALPSEG